MASTLSGKARTDEPAVVTLEDFGAEVMRRRAALVGGINMPRNSGKRRTESKKALLAAIEAAGGSGEGWLRLSQGCRPLLELLRFSLIFCE